MFDWPIGPIFTIITVLLNKIKELKHTIFHLKCLA